MAVVTIKTEPNDVLHKKCEQVTEINSEIKEIVKNLEDTLNDAKDPEGAGLAAPQIGVPVSICVVRKFIDIEGGVEDSKFVQSVIINPVVTKTSREKEEAWEACLSIPDVYAKVERPKKVKVEAMDVEGNKIKINASGYYARVIQHEIDHLNGILITDIAKGPILNNTQFEKLLESYK